MSKVKRHKSVFDSEFITQWDYEKNIGLDPKKITLGSGKKIWWVCCNNHKWKTEVYHRLRGGGCPYCAGKRACKDNCLAALSPSLVKEWHNIKNNGITPNDITNRSHKKVWWQCEKGHEWEAMVSNRTKDKGATCPYCSGHKVCRDNSLAALRPDLAAEWHPTRNKSLMPFDIPSNSNKAVWWRCSKGHEWSAKVYGRNAGNSCPYCSGRLVCEENCLKTLYPSIARDWDYTKNKRLTPESVVAYSHKKVWWKCNKGHEWKTAISCRTGAYKSGCPYCAKSSISNVSQKWLDSLEIPVESREVLLKDVGFRVDGFDPKTNTVYEFFGDLWHGNPKVHNLNDLNPVNKKSFSQLFEDTKTRIFRLEQAGYKVTYICEKDFKNK